MMQQYFQIKEQHKDTILFFRLGDFYEMFYDDALLASKELDITLTGRDCGQEERAPMCGVPFHSCESYIARLVEKGYKVAICEQTEDPAKAKGIVRREVVRIITPGTILENNMLDEGKNNFLVSLALDGNTVGICFTDVSTGEVKATEFATENASSAIISELARLKPAEILVSERVSGMAEILAYARDKLGASVEMLKGDADREIIWRHFKVEGPAAPQLEDREVAQEALANLLSYLYSTQMTGLDRISTLGIYNNDRYMQLDYSTRRNLEITETLRTRERRGSLLGVVDRTKTAMGKRLLRSWLEQPLLDPVLIGKRHNAVEELAARQLDRMQLRDTLDGILDIDRLMTRVVYGSANARDLLAVADILRRLPAIRAELKGFTSQLLRQVEIDITDLGDVCSRIERAIDDDPPITVREGRMIRLGYNAELDELRDLVQGGKAAIAKIEAEEREATGIKNLKVGYNKVFGYYIEVGRANSQSVPAHYIRKQTLANCERFITDGLKSWESRVLGAQERIASLEYELFAEVRGFVAEQLTAIQAASGAVACVDVLASLAEVAVRNHYVRPEIFLDGRLRIKNGRHPVIEDLRRGEMFVPNDTEMDMNGCRVMIITGPNMAGKSTYMRQVALIVLLAQIGSFVPADQAEIGLVDSIFTRVGASDDLASGDSTFMVEMKEVAYILNNATPNSLLIFDEIGRGTSTFDGMSIARAVIEYVSGKIKAKSLFATHYHELTDLEEMLSGVRNYNVSVKKKGEEVIFLRKIVRGGADESLGIEIARLAGAPRPVVSRAKDILRQLEESNIARVEAPRRGARREEPEEDPAAQEELLQNAEVLQKLREVELETLSPIEALNLLYTLRKSVK